MCSVNKQESTVKKSGELCNRLTCKRSPTPPRAAESVSCLPEIFANELFNVPDARDVEEVGLVQREPWARAGHEVTAVSNPPVKGEEDR